MEDFLKSVLGLSEEQIQEILRKSKQRSVKALQTKLFFLSKEYKISPANIKKLAQRAPIILTYSTKAIGDKYDCFLQNYGFSKEEFGRLIVRQPRILTYSTDAMTAKMEEYCKKLYILPSNAKRLILSCPTILCHNPEVTLKKIEFYKKIGITPKAILKKPVILSLPAQKVGERMAICECMGLNKRKFVTNGCVMVNEKRLYARAYIQHENQEDYSLLGASNAEFKRRTGINEKLLMELCEYIPELQQHYASYYANKGIVYDEGQKKQSKIEESPEKEDE